MIDCSEEKQFVVEGTSCTLFDDREKALEVDGEKLLIPWCGDKSILIDRFDGRGYLTDFYEEDPNCDLSPDDHLSEEEIAIEKMCDFERYLEMQVDVHELAIQDEEARKREAERSRNDYGAVSFSYDENASRPNGDESYANKGSTEPGNNEQHSEEPYNCPPELQQLLSNFQLPESDKQAHIIEKTAVFVSRQGSQMEIVLKAKQNKNPLFGFLTYDHPLNPFYKEIVRLISQGRYVPKPRQTTDKPTGTLFTSSDESNKSIHEDVYELKLPKVDISNTSYAPLISKFKKINEMAAAVAAANRVTPVSDIQSSIATPEVLTETERPLYDPSEVENNSLDSLKDNNKPLDSEKTKTPSPQSEVQADVSATNESLADVPVVGKDNVISELVDPLSPEEYERIYQEYYKHYYAHYYTHYSNQWALSEYVNDESFNIVQEAAKAAAIAAAAAVNVVQQTRLKASAPVMFEKELDPDDSLTKAADSNFGNIPPSKSFKVSSSKKLDSNEKPETMFQDNKTKNGSLKNPQSHDSHKDKKDDFEAYNSERQTGISFRLARPIPPKSQSTQNTETSAGEIMDIIEAAALEYSESVSKSLRRTNEQLNRLLSHSKSDSQSKSRKRKTRSPKICVIPGIPSPSSSSSSESSPPQVESPYSYTNRSSGASNSNSVCTSPSISVERNERNKQVHNIQSPVQSICNITSPYDNNLCSPVESISNSSSHLTSNWPSCALEDLLDIHEPTSLLDFSADGYQGRKKAAQLVTQLKLTNSITKGSINTSTTISKSSTVNTTSTTANRYRSSPPPAPDSVPAAVAHAVVANMKRRREALEIENKARRRRHRSPPAAYAFARNRISDRSPRRSPTPRCDSYDREDPRDRDDHHSKSKKKHKKSHY
uniref:Splicing factor, suppressor of white-apricot-like protein n=1 Tax=Schistosoma haematobium TaxID=6185 RepID=A0A095BUI8_SCHHA